MICRAHKYCSSWHTGVFFVPLFMLIFTVSGLSKSYLADSSAVNKTPKETRNGIRLPTLEDDVGGVIRRNETIVQDHNLAYNFVEKMPTFPGGDKNLRRYIAKNTHYPKHAKEKIITGRVMVQFIVDKTGKLIEPKVVRGIEQECDKEALRLIKNMPRWIPGKQDGHIVKVRILLPISFPPHDNN
jgi:TonB family protein